MKEKKTDKHESIDKEMTSSPQERTEQEVITQIQEVINQVRPYLQNDGGDVIFKRFENGVVYVSLIGACSNCPMALMTLQDGIENALISEIPEVIKVVGEE